MHFVGRLAEEVRMEGEQLVVVNGVGRLLGGEGSRRGERLLGEGWGMEWMGSKEKGWLV